MIITPYSTPQGPIEKRITLRARSGEQVSLDVSLADEHGRQSAAEYLHHVYESIKTKLNEPVMYTGLNPANTSSTDDLKKIILYIAAFHDSMFGTFNQRSQLPQAERDEFVEIFLLACATVLDGRNISINLPLGRITDETSLD